MKAQNLKSLISIMFISMLMITNVTFAQRGNGNGNNNGNNNGNCNNNFGTKQSYNYRAQDGTRMLNNIPNITDAQIEQITTLRTAFKKDMLPLRNQLNEQRAKLTTLSSTENADSKEINNQIDKMSTTKNQMMKRGSKFQQNVRVLLTDDQRVYFDSRKGNRNGQGYRNGNRGNRGHRNNCGGGCFR